MLKAKEKRIEKEREGIKIPVRTLLDNSVPIMKAEMVVRAVKEQHDIEVNVKKVKDIMKDEMGVGYRMTRKIPV